MAYDRTLGGLQFVEKYPWVKAFGITYHVGVEGLNAPLLLLTGIVIFTGVLTMWELEVRTKEYFIWMLALVTGVFGVFMSYDLFLFFLFYEIAVVPMYILILVWGSTRKEYAAMKLTLYLMAGSGLIIPGILLLYSSSGLQTFDMIRLHAAHFPYWTQRVAFVMLFFGFGVLAAVWPFHTWSPVGHVAAPTAVSMLHAGVLMKLGSFAILRVAMYLCPVGFQLLGPAHGPAGHRGHCLRRLRGPGPDRLEVCYRLFLGVPHGHRLPGAGHRHGGRTQRQCLPDVRPRRHDRPLLLFGGLYLRPHPYP